MDREVDQILAAAEVATELFSASVTAMSLYFTAISGYLLVAYFQGEKLTRTQAAIITVLFVYFAAFITLGTVKFFQLGTYFGGTYGAGLAPVWAGPAAGVIQVFGIIAALKFMWDIRHSDDE